MKVAIHRCSICNAVRLASSEGLLDRFTYSQRVLRRVTATTAQGTVSAVLLAIPGSITPCAADEDHVWQLRALVDIAQTEGVITVNATAINVAPPPPPVVDPPDPDDATFVRFAAAGFNKDQARIVLGIMRDVVAGRA